jgi:hypothetical protein
MSHWVFTYSQPAPQTHPRYTVPSIISLVLPSLTPFSLISSTESTTFMSLTGQPTSSHSTVQLIIDALADYTKVTGIDLSNNPFAAAIEHSTSPEAILELLQEGGKAFKEYRNGNRKLISCLRPVVKVIQSFSAVIGEAASLVSHTCHQAALLVTLSDPVSTGKSFVCWHRYSPFCTSLERFPTTSPVTDEDVRLLVQSRPVMMLFLSCSSAWAASSSV